MAKRPMTTSQNAKKKKIPDRIVHSIVRNDWAIMNVKNMFMLTVINKAELRVSSGNVSLGINQPRGPHDHAKPAKNKQIKQITAIE